jgi:hypothetical protein
MRSTPDGANELPEWPSVLKIANDEFQQSVAVARLAVKLWENKIARVQVPLEKDKVRDEGPQKFLEEAWKLIQRAREHVLREQTDADYLAAHGGSHEAAENVVGHIRSKSRIQFRRLCDPKRNKGDRELIVLRDAVTGERIEVDWLMYRGAGGERAFDTMFRSYWEARSRIEDEGEREECGRRVLASWKKDGVPGNDFRRFARFRREADDRSANLKKSGA